MPQMTPDAAPATNRVTSATVTFGANAVRVFAMTSTAMAVMSNGLRRRLRVRAIAGTVAMTVPIA